MGRIIPIFSSSPAGLALVAPPPVGGGAPEPDGGSTILFSDDFDQTTLTLQLAPLDDNGPSGFARVTPGRLGSGACLRLVYGNGGTGAPIFGFFIAPTTDLYIRFYFRVSSRWLPYSGATSSGFKWLTLDRGSPSHRYTNGVGRLPGGPVGFTNVGWEFSTHDQTSDGTHGKTASPNPVMSNIDKSIRFDTCNDFNWHKYTLRTVTAAGGGYGYEQTWIDDVLVQDSRTGQPGIPAGGYDHDPAGIENPAFGGLVVDGIPGDVTTGSVTLTAVSDGYTRSSGSFVTDGFDVDGKITPSGFVSNPVSVVTNVTASKITVADARSAEGPTAGCVLAETWSGSIDYDDMVVWHN